VTLLAKLSLLWEGKLLLTCTRLNRFPAQRNELNPLVEASLRWEKVLYKAQRHGLTGLVFYHF
jgi:hypothetical protein